MEMMPCPNCGELNSVKRQTCYVCQSPLHESPAVPPASPGPPSSPEPITSEPATPEPEAAGTVTTRQLRPLGQTAEAAVPTSRPPSPESTPPAPTGRAPRSPLPGRAPSSLPLAGLLYPFLRRVKDDAVFYRQLESLVRGGLPLVSAVREVSSRVSPRIRRVLADILPQIEAGGRLSDAMARHGTLFSATHLGLIRSGETGGFLAEALDEIATGLEMEYELRAHLIANSWYFGLLFIVVAVVLPILLALIWMPKDLDYNLPNFLRYCLRYFYRVTLPILVGPLVVLVLAQQLFSRPTWETWRQRQVLRLPVVGGLAKKAALARFTRTLSVLWAGGVPLAQAVEDAASATGNATIIGRLRAMLPDLQHGGTLSDGMAGTRLFHRDVISMVVTGEQAGDLPTMLDRVAHFYRADLDSAIRVLPRVLLMILYVVSSALVLAMVAALYLAVYARIFAEAEKLMP